MRIQSIKLALAAALITTLTTGCSLTSNAPGSAEPGIALQGSVHGGQQPISGAHVYLMAAGTSGYGGASTSVINSGIGVLSDSVGSYVLTDANGNFSITGDYVCTPGTQVYLYSLGGNPGAGVNPAAGLLAVLGNCPNSTNFFTTIPTIQMNEVTTIAAAFAFAGFATDATHVSSSGSALAQTGIANAFANSRNLANVATGLAQSKPVANNGTVPTALINSLADALAACVNSAGGSTICSFILGFTRSNGSTGTTPTDTATSAINMAHNPTNTTYFQLIPSSGNPYQPTLATTPNDASIAISFTGGGISGPGVLAIDASGNVWSSSLGLNASHVSLISKFSPLGVPLSGTSGFVGGGLTGPYGIAIDLSGNAWVGNYSDPSKPSGFGNTLSEFSNSGSPISTSGGFTGGGLSAPISLALDGLGNVYVANSGDTIAANISVAQSNGVNSSSSGGYPGGGLSSPNFIALDAGGILWVTNSNNSITIVDSNCLPCSSHTNKSGSGINLPESVAIDSLGRAWIANNGANSLLKATRTATTVTAVNTFFGGGLNKPNFVAIDGAGNVWVSNGTALANGPISEFNNSGVAISSSTGFTGGLNPGNGGLAVDGSGNLWVADSFDNQITEFVGIASPVVTPLVQGQSTNTLGTRP